MSASVPRISVIVPCYNIESYVSACLDSLAMQTHNSFEVICIDDGSKDSTGALLNERASQDPRFKVIHQNHKGPAAARRIGVANSKSLLVSFVDGDDVVSKYYLTLLEGILDSSGADMACGSYRESRTSTTKGLLADAAQLDKALVSYEILNPVQTMKCVANSEINLAFWSKLMRREILVDQAFPKEQVYYEDLWGLGALIAQAATIAKTNACVYDYVSRKDSVTRLKPAPLAYYWHFRDAMKHFEEDYQKVLGIEHASDDASYCLHLVHRLCGQYGVLKHAECDEDTRRQLIDQLHEELASAYKLARFREVPSTHPQMMRAAILLRSPLLHDTLLSLYHRVSQR